MESVIAKLLQDFEQGKMSRRQLIQSLSLAAAAAAGMAPAARASGKPLQALYVNHISYEVNDYAKVRDFYVDLLGMKVTEDDGKQCRLVFGNNMHIPVVFGDLHPEEIHIEDDGKQCRLVFGNNMLIPRN